MDEYKLTQIAYKVIEEEELPRPEIIKFSHPVYGTHRRKGSCIKKKSRGSDNFVYTIIVSTISAKFVPIHSTYTGRTYIFRKTGERVRKVKGDKRDNDEIIKTLAHEIAHLKIWRHNIIHKNYTQHILKKILENLEAENNGRTIQHNTVSEAV